MIFRQHQLACLSLFSYLIGDETTGRAVVVDPQRDELRACRVHRHPHRPRFVTAVVTPRLRIRHRFVPGQPKRFAQGIGVAFSGGAALAWLLGSPLVALVLVAGLTAAATLKSVFAVCLGCIVFGQLMRWRLIPESICIECADISARLRQALAERAA